MDAFCRTNFWIKKMEAKRVLFLFLVQCFFLFPVHLHAQAWSLNDSAKGWNAHDLVALYFHNSELQTQWAWEALSNYTFKGNEHVLDFGSGDGKLSALISFMVPNGSVCGVDVSKEMIHFAKKMFPSVYYKNLSFLPTTDLDFSDIVLPHRFDIVTSFCVFHLLPYPTKVLKNIKPHLHAKSQLIATFPIGGNTEFFRAAQEEFSRRGWDFPSATVETKAMRDPDKVHQIFKDSGFEIMSFKVVDTRNAFSTKKEMIDWFEGTLSANWHIPIESRREFFEDLANRYLAYRPQDAENDGFVYFRLKRIDLVAKPVF
jgi:trans-aconitate 2-methyltransferase